jgi:arylsulfatase A-like enzyme
LVSNLDLVPTVLDLAGVKPPEYIDGRSLTPLLKGMNTDWREDLMAQHYGHFAVRLAQRALYYQNFKYIAEDGDMDELYDLQKDPFELENLVNDPASQEVARMMRRRLLAKMDRHGDAGEDVKALREAIKDR